MRDDVALLAGELIGAYEKKLSLVGRMKDNSVALGSYLLSGNDSAIDDITAEDSFLIASVELADFSIASILSRIADITGTEREKIIPSLLKETPQGIMITQLQKKIQDTLSEALESKGRIIDIMEKRMKDVEKSIEDLSGMRAMKKYILSKDPLL